MFKPLEPPAANAPANAPCEDPSTSEGSHVEGDCAVPEKVSVDAPPPPDLSLPASSSSSLRDGDEPLTPRMEVRTDSLSGIFDAAADTLGSSPAGYLLPLDNTYAMSSTVSVWPRVDVLVANNIMQDEGEFDHYHKQIMASRDPNCDFFVPDNSTSW